MDMKEIGKNIASMRKANGYTQETLAEKLGLSPQAISKWETGIGLPEVSVLIELAELFRTSVDEIIRPHVKQDLITAFISRNLASPDSKLLNDIPRISRWNPPEGCDMWYSFPAMMATALCYIETQEKNLAEMTYQQLNERFCEVMHLTGMGYGFLWNVVERHLIEELWHVNDLAEMVGQVMGYYGRDYLWLTPENSSKNDIRQMIMWSIDHGRPVMAEWLGGLPEFSLITGYENNGETLLGYTYCEECAVEINEYGMFVNPARWDEIMTQNDMFHVLVIGDKKPSLLSDRDTIAYALQVLDKNVADNKNHFLAKELIAGDKALQAWLDACDTDEATVHLFKHEDIFRYFLYKNSVYTQTCILPYYKKLGGRSNKNIHDTAIQIDIAVGAITREGEAVVKVVKEQPNNISENAMACRNFIKNFIKHRECLRGWLREIMREC